MNFSDSDVVCLGFVLVMVAVMSVDASSADGAMAKKQLMVGHHVLKVTIAVNDPERIRGLKGVRYLGRDAGMLFVYPKAAIRCFWMKDTLIPLSIAFLDERGGVVSVSDMAPNTINLHCSEGNTQYVIEVNKGYFEKVGLKRGDHVKGLPRT